MTWSVTVQRTMPPSVVVQKFERAVLQLPPPQQVELAFGSVHSINWADMAYLVSRILLIRVLSFSP